MSLKKPLVVSAEGTPRAIQAGDYLDPSIMGSGTRDGTKFLRDDGTYAVVPDGVGIYAVTYNLSGAFTSPIVGVSRRYISDNRTFTKATIGLGVAASNTLTATIKKNGTTVGTITVATGQYYNTNLQSISITAGDYLTVDVSGGNASDLVLTLE